MDDDTASRILARGREKVVWVWQDNWKTLRVWLRLGFCWHVTSAGQPYRLDYPAVKVIMESMGVWPDDGMMQDLQAMEAAALETWNGE